MSPPALASGGLLRPTLGLTERGECEAQRLREALEGFLGLGLGVPAKSP